MREPEGKPGREGPLTSRGLTAERGVGARVEEREW